MATLTARAVITAIDRASPVFGRIGHAADATARRLRSATGRVSASLTSLGSAASLGVAGGGGLGAALSFAGQYEVEKVRSAIRTVGELTESELEGINAAAKAAALTYGHSIRDVLAGGRELVAAGIDARFMAAGLDSVGIAARVNQMPLEQMAEMLVRVSRMMGYSMSSAEEVNASMRRSSDLLAVAPAISTDSTQGFFDFLRYYGPIAKTTGQSEVDIAAMGATLADLGFPGESGGAAARTIMARMVSMSPKARAAFRAEGGQLEGLFDMDPSRLGDMGGLQDRLKSLFGGKGINLKKFTDPSRFGELSEWRDALTQHILSAYGVGKGDAQSRKEVTAAVEQHLSRAVTKIDPERMFEHIGALGTALATDAELAGKQRLQQFSALKSETARKLYKEKRQLAAEKLAGATNRRHALIARSFDTELDKLGAAWTVFRDRVFKSGADGVLTRGIRDLTGAFTSLSSVDPGKLQAVALGVAGVVVAPAAVWAISSLGGALATLGGGLATVGAAFAKAPLLGKLLMGGGLLSLADLGSALQGPVTSPDVYGPVQPDFTRSPLGMAVGSLVDVGRQVVGVLDDIVGGVRSMLGIDGQDSALVTTLKLIHHLASGTAHAVQMMRQGGPELLRYGESLLDGSVDKPATDSTMFGFGVNDDRLLRDMPPVSVTGQATVGIDNRVRIEIEGPGRVIEQQNGSARATVPLNTGKSMGDIQAP